MVGGWSSFEAVLDRVGNDRADTAADGSGSWTAMRGWNSSFVGASLRSQPWPGREQGGAADLADHTGTSTSAPRPEPTVHNDAPRPSPKPVTPAPRPEPAIDISHFKRLSPKEVAKDINLLASDTAAMLQSKRRSFARRNHPDRSPVEWREAATIRMKIANHMVDEALRRMRAPRT
jgi:hypothetical protein